MEPKRENYVGREQAYAKHCILQGYLQKLTYKVGWEGVTLNYIDGFAGPWKSQTTDLVDTSPHVALRVLRATRDQLANLGRPRTSIRAMFVERSNGATALRESLAQYTDIETLVLQDEFENVIQTAVKFATVGKRPFSFGFIDPCGWVGYGMKAITPLLRVPRGEVLVNFMLNSINEWIDTPRRETARTFEDLFGSPDFGSTWKGLDGLDRQEAIVTKYCSRLKEAGGFTHVVSTIVLRAKEDRAQYHLVYGTRSDEGLRVFREMERATLPKQQAMRATALAAKRKKASGGQREFSFGAEALASAFDDELRSRYLAKAQATVDGLLQPGARIKFEDLAVAAMQHPLIAEQDVKNMLVARGERVRIEGLKPRARVPQWGEGHVIVAPRA
ncbi:MAG: three-Cys-motif partner protein TcmP [Planctomycetes bacterium]|jgi:three-Cys-motif partner protein|nr:three-Cys-motif partner protein TcmP [Planctomycetota bacterium]